MPDWTCSLSGSYLVTYTIENYNGIDAPSWVSINQYSGLLKMLTPNVEISTNYSFYVVASISGTSTQIKKIINLRVNICRAAHWQIWTSINFEKWDKWELGYDLLSGTWNNEPSEVISSLSISINTGFGLVSIISLLLNFTQKSSLSTLWALVNLLQLLLLLLLTNAFFPTDVVNIIVGSQYIQNPFDSFGSNKFSYSSVVIDYFDYTQNNNILSLIGVDSGSTFVNIYPLLSSVVYTIFAHFIVLIIYKISIKWLNRSNTWLLRIWRALITKAFVVLTFGYYIRTIFESYQILLISSISEILNSNYQTLPHILSNSIWFLALLVWLMYLLFAFWRTFYKYAIDVNSSSKLEEFFSGLKDTKKAKLYTTLFLVRRIAFISLLLVLSTSKFFLSLGIISGIQAAYILFLIIVRPFSELKDNFIEILNELMFSVYLNWLFFYNTESDWSNVLTNVYIGLIVSNNFLIALISIGNT